MFNTLSETRTVYLLAHHQILNFIYEQRALYAFNVINSEIFNPGTLFAARAILLIPAQHSYHSADNKRPEVQIKRFKAPNENDLLPGRPCLHLLLRIVLLYDRT